MSSSSSYPKLSQPSGPPKSFTVVLFPGFQLLDACGPLDMLNTLANTNPDLTCNLVSTNLDPVPVKHPALTDFNPLFSQSLQPTHTFSEFLASSGLETDVLFIPGGIGSREPAGSIDPAVDFLKTYLSRGLVKHSIFTVCTGSRVLAQTGYLDDLSATTNKISFRSIADTFPAVRWVKKARWVRDGEVWTCSGVSAGIDGMAAFVATWWGQDTAQDVCRRLEYRWCGMDAREIDEFADLVD